MHTQLKAMRLAVAQMQEQLDTLEAALAAAPLVRHSDCVSDVPPGWDTVLGYLAKYRPDILAMFDYADPSATQRDGFWLAHQVKRRGRGEVRFVLSPPILQRAGIASVRAYPLDLLQRRFG
jgi:hypothetical protein